MLLSINHLYLIREKVFNFKNPAVLLETSSNGITKKNTSGKAHCPAFLTLFEKLFRKPN